MPAEMQRTYIATDDRHSLFYRALRIDLQNAGVNLVDSPADASAVLAITYDETDQRVLSVSARNVPTEYEVFYTIQYNIDSGSKRLLEPQNLTVTRDYTYDELLVLGPWDLIGRLQRDSHDFVVLTLPSEMLEEAPARRLAPVSILIVVAMVVLSALEIVPVVLAVLMASLAAVFLRTMTMSDAYRSINWSTLVLIAGMLPAALALVARSFVSRVS